MNQKEAKETLKSILEFEFGNDAVTDLRVQVSNGVVSFQGSLILEGEDNEF